MMKLTYLVLLALLVVGLAACGGSVTPNQGATAPDGGYGEQGSSDGSSSVLYEDAGPNPCPLAPGASLALCGSLSTFAVDAAEGGAAAYVNNTTSGVRTILGLSVSSAPNICADGLLVAGSNAFLLELVSSETRLEPGTWTIQSTGYPGTGSLNLFSFQSSSACDAGGYVASSGTVTVTSLDGSFVAGRFDVTLENGQTLLGSFEAPTCAKAFYQSAECQ
jgi:hypothetical protein